MFDRTNFILYHTIMTRTESVVDRIEAEITVGIRHKSTKKEIVDGCFQYLLRYMDLPDTASRDSMYKVLEAVYDKARAKRITTLL